MANVSQWFSSPQFLMILTVLVFAGPFILILIKWADKKIDDLIIAHVANKNLANVLVRLNDTVWTLVTNAENTVVNDLKGKNGKLEPEDGQKVKNDVINDLKSLWGKEGLQELMDVLGIASEEALHHYLGAKVETAVAVVNKEGAKTISPLL